MASRVPLLHAADGVPGSIQSAVSLEDAAALGGAKPVPSSSPSPLPLAQLVVAAVKRSRVLLTVCIVAGWILTTLALSAVAYLVDGGANPFAVYFYNTFTVRPRRLLHSGLRGRALTPPPGAHPGW